MSNLRSGSTAEVRPRTPIAPSLMIGLPSYAAEDPGDWEHLFNCARAADEAGVDDVVASDHIVFGENLEAYTKSELGGRKGARQPTTSDGPWLEPLTVLAVICGITSRVRLSTGILLAALRRPVVLAKTAATLDVLSRGRFALGVGVGWQREEYDSAGLKFEDRGRLLDQTLEVCQTLWRDSPAQFSGDTLHFEKIHCHPQPSRPGGVPIWVSGTLHPRVLQRIVRFGSGWIPWGDYTSDPRKGIPLVRDALADAGRDPFAFEVRANLPTAPPGPVDLGALMDRVPAMVEGGVTQFMARLPIPADLHAATDYLAEVVAAFRQAVPPQRNDP